MRLHIPNFIPAALLALCAACGNAPTFTAEPLAPPAATRIDHVAIVDPRDGSVQADMSILIEDGVIASIDPSSAEAGPESGLEIVDASGQYAVPGYNNMHSHVISDAEHPRLGLLLMLAEGVTGFRQMSGSPDLLAAREDGKLDIERGPALLAMPGEVMTPFNAGSVSQAEGEILKQARAGADFIKIGLVDRETFFAAIAAARAQGLPTAGHLPSSVSFTEAVEAGFGSMEHFGTGSNLWFDCASDPARFYDDPANKVRIPGWLKNMPLAEQVGQARLAEILVNPAAFEEPEAVALRQAALDAYDPAACRALARKLAAQKAWQVPTLVRLRTQELADLPEYETDPATAYMSPRTLKRWRSVNEKFGNLPEEMRSTFREAYARRLEVIRLWDEEGVPMMTGTDGGAATPGQSMRQEFGELAKAGLPALKILQMTTILPAEFLGRQDEMGLVAPGMPADLVLLSGDPLADAANLSAVEAVIRRGRYYSSEELEALIAEASSAD